MNLDYILGRGGGGVGRRICSSGSIEGKDPVRRSKKFEWKKVSNLEILRYRVPPLFIFGWAIFERF